MFTEFNVILKNYCQRKRLKERGVDTGKKAGCLRLTREEISNVIYRTFVLVVRTDEPGHVCPTPGTPVKRSGGNGRIASICRRRIIFTIHGPYVNGYVAGCGTGDVHVLHNPVRPFTLFSDIKVITNHTDIIEGIERHEYKEECTKHNYMQ